MDKALVTGGAGFIGSHVVDLLLEKGYEVRVIDSLEEQVHGKRDTPPAYLNPEVEFIHGNVLDREAITRALDGVDVVCHQAAAVGVAQSMYQIYDYVRGNDLITASLLQAIVDGGPKIKKLVVASSMSIYGEGRYQCKKCGLVAPGTRSDEQLASRQWDLLCDCGQVLEALPTDEAKTRVCESVYAVGKKVTEELAMVVGQAYNIPTVALRYFNVYGPRQALSNPYTGLLAIVASSVLAKKPMPIFEDGKQMRDFTFVRDIARANLASIEWDGTGAVALNVGTGRHLSVMEVASEVRKGLGGDNEFQVQGKFRSGDIRHCYADASLAEKVIGFTAETRFEDGLPYFLDWSSEEEGVDFKADKASGELAQKGLIK